MEPNSESIGETVEAPIVNAAEQESESHQFHEAGKKSSDESSSGDSSDSSSSSGSDSSDSESESDSDSSSEDESESEGSGEEDLDERNAARASKRKPKAGDASSRKKRFRFLDVEADVGSGDEEDEEFIDDEGAAREAREGGRESRELEVLRREAEQRRKAGGGNRLQSVIQRLEERAAAAASAEGEASSEGKNRALQAVHEGEYEEEDYEEAAAVSGALFPTADDYKLFFVRMAEPGKEREAVIQLCHKAAEERSTGIRSVFSIDSLRGYIYIEALSETVARTFLAGIRKVQSYSLVLVPQSEMASLFRVAIEEASEKFKQLQPGEFVRIKRHPVYKGDLARVIECYDRDVEVALVPRMDWWGENKSSSNRPPRNLFDDKVAESIGAGEVERLRNPSTGTVRNHFKNEIFSDEGFVIKRFNRSTVVVGENQVNAKLDEIRWFNSSSKKESDQQKHLGSMRNGRGSVLRIGDIVKVVSGDLKNFTGKVTFVDKQKSIVSVLGSDNMMNIQVLERDVEKIFKLSDHVRILSGNSAGDTGLVTAVEAASNIYTILVDGEMREVKEVGNSLEVTSDVSRGETSLGNYQLGQLVQISSPSESVGLILKISKSGHFSILSLDNKRISVTLSDIGGNKSVKDAVAVSRHGDVIKKGSVVKFFGIGNLVKTGTVKEIHRNALFVKDSESGIAVIDCKFAELVASAAATSKPGGIGSFGAPPAAPAVSHSAAPQRRFGGAANRLEGKRVRIIKGQYKGQLAQVREDHDTKVQLSLEAKFRVVTIPKDCVRIEDEEDFSSTPHQHQSTATGNINQPPMGSLSQPPVGYVPPSSTPFTPAPPHLSK